HGAPSQSEVFPISLTGPIERTAWIFFRDRWGLSPKSSRTDVARRACSVHPRATHHELVGFGQAWRRSVRDRIRGSPFARSRAIARGGRGRDSPPPLADRRGRRARRRDRLHGARGSGYRVAPGDRELRGELLGQRLETNADRGERRIPRVEVTREALRPALWPRGLFHPCYPACRFRRSFRDAFGSSFASGDSRWVASRSGGRWRAPGRGVPAGAGSVSESVSSWLSLGTAGRRMMKVAPSPGRLVTEMPPPWLLMIRWQIASPSPVPFSFVV